MDLNALELFVAAARAGSLSEAARRTGVPLPTLSRRVRKLEDELGRRLLERGPQGLALTPSGTQLLAEAGPALASLAQAEQRLHDLSGVAGRLRVSLPPHFEPMWPVFASFGARHPAVRFDVFITDRRVDLVADGVDVALRVGAGGSSTYVGPTLARYRHRLVAAPEFLCDVELTHPEELAHVACACWRTRAPPVWTLGEHSCEIEPVFVTNDYAHLLHMAVSGQVLTEVPPFMAAPLLSEGALVEVLPEFPMPLQTLRALVVETRALSPLVRQFLDFAVEHLPPALAAGPSPDQCMA